MFKMITLSGKTHLCESHRGYGFSFSELNREALKRGFVIESSTTKWDLINLLCEKEVLHRKDVIATPITTTAMNKILVTEIGKGSESVAVPLSFSFIIAGVSSSGKLVVFEITEGSILSSMHLYSSDGKETEQRRVIQKEFIHGVPVVSGNLVIFLDELKEEFYGIKIFNLETLELKTLPKSEGGFRRIYAKGNTILTVNYETHKLEIWDLEAEKIISRGKLKGSIPRDILLFDSTHFAVRGDDEHVYLVFRVENKWNLFDCGKKQTLGLSNGRFVTADSHSIYVYNISPPKLLSEFMFSPGEVQLKRSSVELRDGQVLFISEEGLMFTVDIDEERITYAEETFEEVFYFPPDVTERRKFLKLISESVPRSVPIEIAGIIEKFI